MSCHSSTGRFPKVVAEGSKCGWIWADRGFGQGIKTVGIFLFRLSIACLGSSKGVDASIYMATIPRLKCPSDQTAWISILISFKGTLIGLVNPALNLAWISILISVRSCASDALHTLSIFIWAIVYLLIYSENTARLSKTAVRLRINFWYNTEILWSNLRIVYN